MKINANLLKLLPRDLRIEIDENICRRNFRQSTIAKIQRFLISKLEEYNQQGKRNDLAPTINTPTCTPDDVQVPTKLNRRENTVEKVAKFFGESERTVRNRLALVQAAESGDQDASRYLEEVNRGKTTLTAAHNKFARIQRSNDLTNEEIRLPESKFRVIYVDPAWPYRNAGFGTSAEAHYCTMELPEICAIPVQDRAADDCILLLWATNPLLPEALEVIKSWGFVYKQNYVWVKDRVLPGFHHLSKHELLLVATKGSSCLPTGKLIESVIVAPRREHSRKPELYEMIERLYRGPYLELFARNRQSRLNWTFWGNQAKSDISSDCITDVSKSEQYRKMRLTFALRYGIIIDDVTGSDNQFAYFK